MADIRGEVIIDGNLPFARPFAHLPTAFAHQLSYSAQLLSYAHSLAPSRARALTRSLICLLPRQRKSLTQIRSLL